MAKKTRRQKERSAARQPALAQARPRQLTGGSPIPAPSAGRPSPAQLPAEDDGSPLVTGAAAAAAVANRGQVPSLAGEEAPARRRVERIAPTAVMPGGAAGAAGARQTRQAAQRTRSWSAAGMVEPLDSDDPAIPFDRVPYVPADLRRVAVIAGLMVVLILIAWVVVAHVTS